MIKEENKARFKELNFKQLETEFLTACAVGKINLVQYLLTTSDLEKNPDIHVDNDYGLRVACNNNYLNVVEYLLTSPELKEHADIHAKEDGGFIYACEEGRLSIVQYLLTSTELKEHANIHARNDEGFILACNNEHFDIVKYLIFDMNIERTKHIQKYLKEYPNEQVENMFKIRDLNQQLGENLSCEKISSKKVKL